jgi:large subunit ribosomal protein L18
MKDSRTRFELRRKRIRSKISGTAARPRLSAFLGNRNIYAQLIDDDKSVTLAAASTLSAELKGKIKSTDTIAAAQQVGELLAKKGVEKGIKKAVFDRGGHIYHGRIKALADAARKAGLEM